MQGKIILSILIIFMCFCSKVFAQNVFEPYIPQNNEIIFRLVNVSTKKQQAKIFVPKKYENIYQTNLCENSDKKIEKYLEFEPKEIITIKCSK